MPELTVGPIARGYCEAEITYRIYKFMFQDYTSSRLSPIFIKQLFQGQKSSHILIAFGTSEYRIEKSTLERPGDDAQD